MAVEARLRSLSVGAHATARDEQRENTGLSDRARHRGVPGARCRLPVARVHGPVHKLWMTGGHNI